MEKGDLAALFRWLLLASAPLLGSCSEPYPPCNTPEMVVTAPYDPADGGIDGGITDAGVLDLCQRIVQRSVRIKECALVPADGGTVVRVVYADYCVGGRCPDGFRAAIRSSGTNELGMWLAGSAELEAASVDAFQILAGELTAHRAPARLVFAAREAAGDEARHARIMGALASRHGGSPRAVRVARRPTRDLEAIALENAVEGCVRETFAALVACRQARVATDPAIRAAMAGIAQDETRHATLAWAVARWADGQLSPAARGRVRQAREAARDALVAEVARPQVPALRDAAGLPDADEAVRLASALFENLARRPTS